MHRVYVFLVLFLISSFAEGQIIGNREYGKNRVQYKNFEWLFFSTDNFDIYYYGQGKEHARAAIEYLEEEYDRITDVLGYAPYSKTQIFLYNSISDMQQSNIGIDDEVFTIGGQTNFVKLRTEIPFTGTMEEFKQELILRITRMLIDDMMFGGSLADMFQSSYLLSLPDWFVEGAARYVAYEWDDQMDDFIRDLLTDSNVRKLNRIEGEDARLLGQSVWNYVANKYGTSNISNILNLTRIIRNEENSLASTLGIPFKKFVADWQQYYRDATARVANNYVQPEEGNVLLKSRSRVKYHQVKFSPDGSKLVFSENYRGKYNVFIRDLNSNRQERVLSGGYHVINQEVDFELPLINWVDNENLGIIQNHYGTNYLVSYNIPSKKLSRKSLEKFDNIKDFAFNGNGRLAVLSADVNGINDLYLVSMRRNAIRRLTKDRWDDITPRFLPGRDVLIFSSNRTIDSIGHQTKEVKEISNNFNLFVYDLDTTESNYLRLTNTLSKDFQPIPKNYYETFYLSDQKGINNLYRYNIVDSTFNQVTNFSQNIQNYDIHFETNSLVFTMLQGGSDRIFYYRNFDLNRNIFTPQTLRKEIEQARYLRNRIQEEKIQRIEIDPQPKQDNAVQQEDGFIDTDNYVFEEELENTENPDNFSFLSNYRKLEKTTSISGPNPYDTRFSADNVVTSFVNDPLRGFGILLETSMNDMLENHKFYGGVMAISDLKSGDIFGEYKYLKYRLDFTARFDRRVILQQASGQQADDVLQRYIMNDFSLGASLPLTNALRVEFTPHITHTRYLDLNSQSALSSSQPGNFDSDVSVAYIGSQSEVVFDNSIIHGLNLYEGTRARLGFRHYNSITDSQRNFSNLFMDFRHYQKVHREIIFATRLFYGKFFGNNKPKYLLGGMNNWVGRQTESTGSQDPLQVETGTDNTNLLFNQFVTNLRGFNYNEFNGTDAILMNAELRFPIFKYFLRGPISSNFFRTFQVVGFYDVGSAWTGRSPFRRINDVNTQIIEDEGSPFRAVINNSSSPWLASYGFGLRTVLLGFYAKLDIARPIQNTRVGDTRVHLTWGYDF